MPVNSFENYPMSWKPQKSQLERPYYLSLASLLEQDIRSGTLKENTKLPPQRELADFLDLNLSTITRAYKLCELKGLLYAVTGRGTFVSSGIHAQDTFLDQDLTAIEMGMIKPFYECNPAVLSAAQAVLQKPEAVKLLEYSNPFGTRRQLQAAAKWFRYLGITPAEDQIFLTAGAQNALSVAMMSLFRAGDKIAVDHFTYTNFKGLANFLHIQLVPVNTDNFGMNPEALLQTCKNTEVKGVYLMPSCSNPTGIFMPLQRREKLAEIVEQFHLLIIEDDIYSFLDSSHTQSFFSILPEQTIYICSLSKSLCAGLRVAFLSFPEKYRETLETGILDINLKTVSLNAEIIAELIDSGEAMQITQKKISLAKRRNQIFQSVFKPLVQDDFPRFYHWIPLPHHLTSVEAEIQAAKKGVHILGSHRFAIKSDSDEGFIRVSIVSPDTETELKNGLLILKSVLEQKSTEFFV